MWKIQHLKSCNRSQRRWKSDFIQCPWGNLPQASSSQQKKNHQLQHILPAHPDFPHPSKPTENNIIRQVFLACSPTVSYIWLPVFFAYFLLCGVKKDTTENVKKKPADTRTGNSDKKKEETSSSTDSKLSCWVLSTWEAEIVTPLLYDGSVCANFVSCIKLFKLLYQITFSLYIYNMTFLFTLGFHAQDISLFIWKS